MDTIVPSLRDFKCYTNVLPHGDSGYAKRHFRLPLHGALLLMKPVWRQYSIKHYT